MWFHGQQRASGRSAQVCSVFWQRECMWLCACMLAGCCLCFKHHQRQQLSNSRRRRGGGVLSPASMIISWAQLGS